MYVYTTHVYIYTRNGGYMYICYTTYNVMVFYT